jgi:hypothetical protein
VLNSSYRRRNFAEFACGYLIIGISTRVRTLRIDAAKKTIRSHSTQSAKRATTLNLYRPASAERPGIER